ncbi:MAG: SlyX family protein [Pseudomonadota bacterium]
MSNRSLEYCQQQIDELQGRLVHQEDMLQFLNERVAQQDKLIMQLQQQLQHHHKKVDDLAFSIESNSDQKPPHY